MELNNCEHTRQSRSCDRMVAAWEPVIYHFHGTLTRLGMLEYALEGVAQRQKCEGKFKMFLRKERQSLQELKAAVANIFGGNLIAFPGERLDKSYDDEVNNDSTEVHVHYLEFQKVGRFIRNWSVAIQQYLGDHFEEDNKAFHAEAFRVDVRKVMKDLEKQMDSIRNVFAKYL